MTNIPPEFLIDQVQNVNIQGPLVTITFGRMGRGEEGVKEANGTLVERLQVTMTTPNFLNSVNALGQIAKRIVESNKAQSDTDEKVAKEV